MPEAARSTTTPLVVQPIPPPPPPAWQAIAVLGIFSLQFCLMLLIAVRLVPALPQPGSNSSAEFAALQERLEKLEAVRQREADVDAKLEVLELVLRQGTTAPEGILRQLAEHRSEIEQLQTSLRGQQSLTKDQDAKIAALNTALAEARHTAQDRSEEATRLAAQIASLETELKSAREQRSQASSVANSSGAAGSAWWRAWVSDRKSLGVGALLGATVAAVAVFVTMRRAVVPRADGEPQVE